MTSKMSWTEITRAYARRVLRERGFTTDDVTAGLTGAWACPHATSVLTGADGKIRAHLTVHGPDGWDITLTDLTEPDTRFAEGTEVYDHTEKLYGEVVTPPARGDENVTVVYAAVFSGHGDDDKPIWTETAPARLATIPKANVYASNRRALTWVADMPEAMRIRALPIGTAVTGADHDFGTGLIVTGHNGRNVITSDGLETVEGDARYFRPVGDDQAPDDQAPDDQAPDDETGVYHVQFCEDDRDSTGDPYAATDATEVRIWSEDGTCIIAARRNGGTDGWEICASDVCDWTRYADTAYRTYSAAFDAPFAQHNRPVWLAIQRALSA